MQTVKVALNEASRDQLFYYASTIMGLDVKHNTGETKLLAKISEANPDLKEIEVPEVTQAADSATADNTASEGQTAAPQTAGKPAPKVDPMERKVMVLIDRTEGRDGERPVQVSVNGSMILVPRGEPVPLKMKYVKVLENAVATRYHQTEDGEMKSYEAQLYPFRITSETVTE